MISPELQKTLTSGTHHAYLVVGDSIGNFEKIRHFFSKKISAEGMEVADFWSRSYETIAIDDAREIKDIQNTRPIGERRIMLLSLRAIQAEAQNSLLKLFEEPSHTVFIVLVDSPSIFLPTLLSRFYVFNEKPSDQNGLEDGVNDQNNLVKKFLSGTIQERMNALEPIIKDKDKAQAEKFLNTLESALYTSDHGSLKSRPNERAFIFENIFSARKFLQSRSPSVKMILENICGIVPVTNK